VAALFKSTSCDDPHPDEVHAWIVIWERGPPLKVTLMVLQLADVMNNPVCEPVAELIVQLEVIHPCAADVGVGVGVGVGWGGADVGARGDIEVGRAVGIDGVVGVNMPELEDVSTVGVTPLDEDMLVGDGVLLGDDMPLGKAVLLALAGVITDLLAVLVPPERAVESLRTCSIVRTAAAFPVDRWFPWLKIASVVEPANSISSDTSAISSEIALLGNRLRMGRASAWDCW